ncbi:protein disulfide oxidoreductase [Enterobacter sp.]|uniref:protein disulfide oxidoreductase n=1 Tax=Enterobacter sp. TaxID=42895 RepID=UPI003782D899
MASKLTRLLRELALWLTIGVVVSIAVDYFRQPALPQNFSATALQTPLRSGDNAMLETWLAKKKMTLPTVNDASGELARQWDVQVTPTMVVISHGEVKSITTGWTSSWGMRLRLWLAS